VWGKSVPRKKAEKKMLLRDPGTVKFSAQKQKSQNQKAQEITKIFFLAISTSTEKFGSEFLS